MTVDSIIKILRKTFPGRDINYDSHKWNCITLDGEVGIRFYTYSKEVDSQSIWYCDFTIGDDSREVMIPSDCAEDFISECKDIFIQIKELNSLRESVFKKVSALNSPQIKRDLRIKKVLKNVNL